MVPSTSEQTADLDWSRKPRDTEARLPAGTCVAGRFEVVEPLARGGTAIVYRAIDREHAGAPVALKVVTAAADRKETAARFHNEARLGRSLADHPMLVRPLQVGRLTAPVGFEGRSFLVTELVEGESLASVMSRSRDGLPVRRAMVLARDVASVLAELHERGIVHRDIKPGNLLVTGHGTEERIRLIDFGLAYATGDGWEAKSPDLTEAGHAPGTPVYMPPEQVAHHRPAPSMDIYALGITLYELLAGDPPFHGMGLGDLLAHKGDRKRRPYPIERLCSGLPEEVAELVDRCLRYEPASRPSAADIVAILDGALSDDDETTTAEPERAAPAQVVERAAPAELPAMPRPGDVLGGRFEVIDEIGVGGMGHVYAARDLGRGGTVALKLIIARYLDRRPERVKRFFLEYELANRIAGHPNVVQMLEAGYVEHAGVPWPYLSMELLVGSNLHRHMAFRDPWLPEALEQGRQVAETLRALHAADVVHRDVTSSNVWVCTDGSVKLLDFSHAGDLRAPPVPAGDPRRLTVLNDMLGNLLYIAPEQARREPPHPSADVYSFGLLLAELVTGEKPRQHVVDEIFVPELLVGAVPPVQLSQAGIPATVAELVTACTQVDPGARPSMDEVVARLDEAIARVQEQPAQEAAVVKQSVRVEAAATGRGRWWMAGATVGVLAIGLVAWGLGDSDAREPTDPAASVAGVDAREAEPAPSAVQDDAAPTPEAGSDDGSDAGSSGAAPVPLPSPAPASELPQPEPEPPPTPQAPKKVKPHAPSDDDAERCAAQVEQAREAAALAKWQDVLRLTKSAKCFRPSATDERLRLRIKALAETRRHAECVTLGSGSSDPSVKRIVSICKAARAADEEAP